MVTEWYRMDFGLILPSYTAAATPAGIEAAAAAADRLGWSTIWATDHILVHRDDADYSCIFEPLTTLAYLAARHPRLKLGTSVINVPLRNAVVLGKALASLDALTGGRLIVGVGLGDQDDVPEFENLGVGGLYHRRGAFLDETMRMWRHLWSGSGEPFEGAFFRLRDYGFGPLPAHKASLPIIVGGRSPAAYRRAGALSDGYHATRRSPAEVAESLPLIRAAAEAAGRPMPAISVRTRVRLESSGPGYALSGSAGDVKAALRAYADLGVSHMAFLFDAVDPHGISAAAERLQQEVLAGL